jgi:secretion/DNA translocation related TadE-like protein
MIAVLVAITVGFVYVGCAVAARHRAQSAADLAALAAATRLTAGAASACAQANSIAGAMHLTITRCAVENLDVVVTAHVTVTLGRFGAATASAVARAGPAD